MVRSLECSTANHRRKMRTQLTKYQNGGLQKCIFELSFCRLEAHGSMIVFSYQVYMLIFISFSSSLQVFSLSILFFSSFLLAILFYIILLIQNFIKNLFSFFISLPFLEISLFHWLYLHLSLIHI